MLEMILANNGVHHVYFPKDYVFSKYFFPTQAGSWKFTAQSWKTFLHSYSSMSMFLIILWHGLRSH